nr:GRIP and coiled-coil domain-containing protein 1 [Vanessa tameamea]
MESLSKQELISTITKQADQIKRYEGRLRDVVAAYKGLAKEKEALEISLKALNRTENNEDGSKDSIAALTLSLSTLSAEKARMEEAFQTDKKVTRDKYENMLASTREETKTLVQQHLAEVGNLKAKIAYEIQERERERADHAAMLKELHMKLNSERKTKEKLEDKVVHNTEAQDESQISETDNEKLADSEYLQTLIDKIHILKKELIAENDKLGNPIELSAVFKLDGYENIHSKCRLELENLKIEFETYKLQNAKVKESGQEVESEMEDLKSEMAVLKEKTETYILLLEDEKQDKLDSLRLHEEKLKSEKEYHKEVVSDLKTRIQSLEKQVQTQRDRYATLLEETDNYIRSRNDRSRKVSTEEGNWKDGHGVLNDGTAPPHMLHYAHELARKDLDITQLRREKHTLEGQFRDCQREATIEKERFKEVIRTLKEEIDRLRRIQSREGANLEYLKNVVMAYLMSSDYAGRKHMLNAIAAVLHFTDNERKIVFNTL